jgi:hypothetical protein
VNVAVRDPSQGRYRSIAQRRCIKTGVFSSQPDNESRDGLTFYLVTLDPEDFRRVNNALLSADTA